MRPVVRRLIPCLLFLICFTPAILAQSQATTGVIDGRIVDSTGAALPGVTVTLKNTATNFVKVLVTDADGRYRGGLLPLGPYDVTAELSGFGTVASKNHQLGVGQTLDVNIELAPSAVSQEIIVTAEVPVVETSRVEGTTRIDQDSINKLPNNGRNFMDFTKLTPGVAIVQGPDGDEISVNGQKGIQNNVSVDGADFNNPFFGEHRGGQRPPFTFNLDAVQEVVVVADGASAEFGRSSSGFVNVITKSGTNEIKGSAHMYYKDDGLSSAAEKPDGTTAPKFASDQSQVGFTLGGPIRRDETFFFIAMDLQDSSSTKQTESSRIEQRVVDYFASIGSPNENGSIDRTNDARVALAKIDWNASANNLATFRYAYTWSEQKNGTFDVDSWGRSANATEKDYSHAVTGSLLTSLGPNLLSEFRFQWAREDRPRPYPGPLVTGQSRPLPDTAFDFGASYRFGEPFFIPVIYNDTRKQLNENISWISGRHSMKAGIEYNETAAFQTFIGFANGRYIFSSTDGFLNYTQDPNYLECKVDPNDFSEPVTGATGACPSGYSIVGPVLLYLQQAGVGGLTVEESGTQTITQKEPAVFFQDSWQPTDNITVDMGLRWEAQIEPDPITPPSEVFYAPFIGQESLTGAKFPSDGKIPSDYGMWQPRFGIAWDPKGNGDTVVRANAGLYYSRVPGLVLASSRSTNGSRGQTIFRNSALTGILGPVPAYPNLIPADEIGDPFLPDVFVFDEDFQNPRTTAVAVGVDQKISPDLALVVKLNYAKTDHLTRFINRNDPLLGSPWGSGLEPGGFNGINTLTVVESSARSEYQGITVGLNKRWSNNFQFQAYYTYSEDKSDDDNERDPFSFRYAKVTDLDAEYSWSDRDQRHRANAWLLWNAPYGVDVNFRYSYRSAQPKSITASGADAATPQDRCSAIIPGTSTCEPDAVVTKRNLGRKDNQYSSLDIRLSKDLSYGGVTVQPIVDVFNLLNSKNLVRPEVTSLVFNFDGTVRSGNGDPRQTQVGLRVVW